MSATSPWSDADRRFMARALELASQAAEAGEVPVGAVLADPASERIIAEGANRPIGTCDPTAHAEIVALRTGAEAIGNYRLTGLSLYVTLEPCAMCAGAISHARIARLVYGAADEKGGAIASGPRFFESGSCHWAPEVTGGLMSEDAAAQLRTFFRARRAQS